MSKPLLIVSSPINLLAYVRARVEKHPRLNPWRYIDQLEQDGDVQRGCADEARDTMSREYRYLYHFGPSLKQAQRLHIIDAAITTLQLKYR